MIIPKEGKERDNQLKFIIDTCTQSRNDRIALYARRRKYFLFGTSDGSSMHNRLRGHIDLVASFLYSPDHARYSVSPPENSDDETIEKLIELSRFWNDEFRDSDLAFQFGDALLWSLIYETMFIKMGWNDARKEIFGHIVDPAHIGVWREDVPDLDNQQAFVHTYVLDYDEAVQRLFHAGLKSEVKRLEVNVGDTEDESASPVLHNLLLGGQWGPNLTDPIQGVVNTAAEPAPQYQAKTNVPMVKWHELYVWDDQYNDYSIFTVASPDIVISDSRETMVALKAAGKAGAKEFASECNIFLPGEHPFVTVQPYGLYDYFWGAAHIEPLIPLQQWSDKRLQEIQNLLARQVDPAKVFSGFQGLLDEKAAALGGPGTWVMEQIPGAKVDELKPEIPEDCFAELKEIGAIFLEASGLTETLQGRGEQGVRGRGHAKQLAATGSGRIRKVAVGLEKPLAKLGDLGLKLISRNCDERLRTSKKLPFLPAQAGDEYKIRIAGHSHSPLFRDETKDDALVMLKAQAIDQEQLIRILNPPNAEELIYQLRKRLMAKAKAEQARIAQGLPPDEGKGKGKLHAV